MALQRFVKRVVEREIFAPLIDQAGYDPKEAGCRLNWGMPEKPELIVADLLRATELGLIRPNEFRGMMKKMGWELTEAQPSAKPGVVPVPEVLWTEAMWTFAEQEQCKWVTLPDGRKVCIRPQKQREPIFTVKPEKKHLSKRAILGKKHAESCELTGKRKAEFERKLMDYRSQDLDFLSKMRSVKEDQMIENYRGDSDGLSV